VAESPGPLSSADDLLAPHGTSNAQRDAVTAHGVCLPRSRGVTLLELLVVMLILLMVTAAAIPIIAPALQNRSMREATRLVTSYLGAAKARAVQTGRPVGVIINRFNGLPFAYEMAQIEVPPPYSGDAVGAKLEIVDNSSPSTNAAVNFSERFPGLTPRWFKATEPTTSLGMLNAKLLKVGDQIQFNGQGPLYVIMGPDNTYDGAIEDVSSTTPLEFAYAYTPPLKQAFPWLNTITVPQPASYQITRQPVRTSTPPLLLPEGLVFDLSISGVGSMLFNTTNYAAVNIGSQAPAPTVLFDPQIIFSPSGRVEWVSNNQGQLMRTSDPIYLLLGRRDLMFDVTTRNTTTDGRDLVFQNLSPIPNPPGQRVTPTTNFWVVVSAQSGQANTAEIAPHVQDYAKMTGYTLNGNQLSTYQDVITLALYGTTTPGTITGALSFARESQSLGGR
jgi:prepilin-type N-terminal cleavage/methylation domain-containing protein